MRSSRARKVSCILLLVGCRPAPSPPSEGPTPEAPTTETRPETAAPAAAPSPARAPVDPEREARIEQALANLDRGSIDDAYLMLTALAAEPTDDHRILGALARIRLAQRKLDEAHALVISARELAPREGTHHHTLGRVYEATGRPERAVESYRVAYELAPEVIDHGMSLGHALVITRRWSPAEEVLRAVVEQAPKARRDGIGVHTLLGDVLRETDRLDEALRNYMKAQSLWPSDRRAHAGAAMVYERRGEDGLALDEWSAYVRMDCCSEFTRTVVLPRIEILDRSR